MINFRRVVAAAVVFSAVVTLGGCVIPPREHFTADAVERSQNSVRNIMAAQVLNPEAAQDNAGQAVMGEDGERAAKTLEEYRTKVAGGDEATQGVTINMGSGQ